MAPKKVTPRGKAAAAPSARTTGKRAQPTPPKKRGTTQRYIRAIYAPAGGTRLTLNNGNRFHLQPRGQINDLAPVTKDDITDPVYVQNKNLMFEEISSAEAKKIIEGQATNAQTPRNRGVIEHIRDEYGNPVNQEVKMEQPFEQQGQVVANIEDGPSGRFTDGYQGKITRAPGEAPQQVSVPGSVGNPLPEVPSDVPPEQVADWVARNAKSAEAAADALRSGLSVEVAQAQKEIKP